MRLRNLLKRNTGDSGQVSAFTPAIYVKPEGQLRQIANLAKSLREWQDPRRTTQQGTPGTATPSVYPQTLWVQRFERTAYIEDCNRLYLEDGRVKRSVDMYVREAVRGGFKIKIEGGAALSRQAEKLAEEFYELCNKSMLEEWGRQLILEGDLFAQMVCSGGDLVKIAAMPGASMERLSDDADDIINPEKGYAQVDITSWQEITTFSMALMTQIRWGHRPGNRYGTPELIACRRVWRILKQVEESTAIRGMVRASQFLHHKIGDPKNGSPGSQQDLDNYRAENGFVEGKQEIWDPMTAARNIFSNGNVTIEAIEGDPHLDKIEFIRYLQNLLVSLLPTPGLMFGLDTESVNRDVLEEVMRQWLESTERLNEALDELLRFAWNLKLILRGIDPHLIKSTFVWTTSSIEKPAEQIQEVIELRDAGLVSRRTAVTNIAQHMGVEDVDAELREIERERAEDRDYEAKMAALKPSPDGKSGGGLAATNGRTNGKKEYVKN